MTGFPTDPSKLEVSFAFGADIAKDPAGTVELVYVAVPLADVAPRVVISRGRLGDGSMTTPTDIAIGLNDPLGYYSPRNILSPHYGQLRHNTPVRVRLDPGTGSYVTRGQAYVSDWDPTWVGPDMGDRMELSASGVRRRVRSNEIVSALRRTLVGADPRLYWPMEDQSDATTVASGLAGGVPLNIQGVAPQFGTDPSAAGSFALPRFGSAGSLHLNTPSNESITVQTVEFVARMAPGNVANAVWWPVAWYTADGLRWQVVMDASANELLVSLVIDPDNADLPIQVGVSDVDDDLMHHYRIITANNGSDIDVFFYRDGTLLQTGTVVGRSVLIATAVSLNTGFALVPEDIDTTIGHLGIWSTQEVDRSAALGGYVGEVASVRFVRLCAEDDIQADIFVAGDAEPMGPQLPGSILSLLAECETSDEAVMLERRGGKLGFDSRSTRYNLAPAMTIPYLSLMDLDPSDGDRDLFNDVIVTRIGGSSARYQVDTGPLSVRTDTGAGDYPVPFSRSLHTDLQAENHARWLAWLGTQDEQRAVFTLSLRQHEELKTAWLASDVGSRILITDPPAKHTGPAPMDLIIEGYTEILDAVEWTVAIYALPYRTYEVFQVATGTANRSRIPAAEDTTTVNTQRSATDTSFAITTAAGGVRWIDSATYASAFPVLVEIAGEVMSCTAITGTTLSQTMTMTRGVHGVSKVIPAGSPVQLWRHPVVAL